MKCIVCFLLLVAVLYVFLQVPVKIYGANPQNSRIGNHCKNGSEFWVEKQECL
jgi:hypothetical protein